MAERRVRPAVRRRRSAQRRQRASRRCAREIEQHNQRYYDDDAPTISDAEYDALFRELQALEAQHPELRHAPTRRRSGSAARRGREFAPVAHARADAVDPHRDRDHRGRRGAKFDARMRRDLELAADAPPVEYMAELKFDGLAISLRYENGALAVAATRGDGEIGEDVTRQRPHDPRDPARAARREPPPVLEVRGEVYMTRARLRGAQRAAAGGRAQALRQSAQHRGRRRAPARSRR